MVQTEIVLLQSAMHSVISLISYGASVAEYASALHMHEIQMSALQKCSLRLKLYTQVILVATMSHRCQYGPSLPLAANKDEGLCKKQKQNTDNDWALGTGLNPGGAIYCEPCEYWLNGTEMWEKHNKGPIHKTSLRTGIPP